MSKRFIALFIILSMALSVFPQLIFAAGPTEVSSFAQLKAALEDPKVTEILLLSNINLEKKTVTINPNKASLVIDGNGKTIFEADSLSQCYTLYLSSKKSLRDITLKNATIIGRNYYGLITIADCSPFSDVTLTYENVTYVGPQMVWARYSNLVLRNCDITVAPGHANAQQQVAEARNVRLEGFVQVTKAQPANCASLFEIDHSGSMTIAAGANVAIANNAGGSKTATSAFICVPTCNTNLIFEDGCIFTYAGYNAFRYGSALENVYVGKNSRVTISINGNIHDSGGLLYVKGNMMVDTGADFRMHALSNNTYYPVINLYNKAMLTVDNPRMVLIYNSSTKACNEGLAISSNCNATVSYNNIRVLEHWIKNTNPPTALGTPTFMWNNFVWNNYRVMFSLYCGKTKTVLPQGYSGVTAFDLKTANFIDVNVIRINGVSPV
jgi:hypothetical protein